MKKSKKAKRRLEARVRGYELLVKDYPELAPAVKRPGCGKAGK